MKSITLTATAILGLVGAANAADIMVTASISTSETWTADNIYNLQDTIFVLPGATLTIEAGTVIASGPTMTDPSGGTLAVAKGGQIFVLGTQDQPVIMTSQADVATWTAGDPKTGVWREAANEWGNLTIMGDGFISENIPLGQNTSTPNPANFAEMEGLIPDFVGDPKVRYGGGNDDDDSGVIKYLSIRYAGDVLGLGDELNGLSLGGLGRGTDIHHVEIMNNVDDGIEIWGGAVNLKYFSIWNVGDDSFDVDQGWRGKAQFGLIVQGYSVDAAQGSGVGDNCFETDGAEDSFWQPVTTTTIYNCTVIGQPAPGAGDGLTAWRDNARVQYRNCIFMQGGEKVVRFDGDDGDGASGYGANGTLSWADHWTTAAGTISGVNTPDPLVVGPLAAFYGSQVDGNLCEITDSVFFQNLSADAYTEAVARDLFAASNNNVQEPATQPIVSITRGAPVIRGTKIMLPVIGLDPRPAGDALISAAAAPADGFFTPANYRGAFEPDVQTWLCGWTASEAFGFTGAGVDCFISHCNGDGGDQMGCTNCPCGNNATPGSVGGCLNSAGTGARLRASGDTSVSLPSGITTDLRFGITGAPGNAFCILNSGDAVAPGNAANPCFGMDSGAQSATFDGLRCAIQNTRRHGGRAADANGDVGVTNNPWGGEAGPPVGLAVAGGGFLAGQTRFFQVINRDDPLSSCMRGLNTSQAIEVTFTP